jgi:hypothetical protein
MEWSNIFIAEVGKCKIVSTYPVPNGIATVQMFNVNWDSSVCEVIGKWFDNQGLIVYQQG